MPHPDQATEHLSYCRMCGGLCGMRLYVKDGRLVGARGDKAHPMTRGYACIKGLQVSDLYHGEGRLLHSQKRQRDGSHRPIASEQALDEIAAKLDEICRRHGPEAMALYKGTQKHLNTSANQMLPAFVNAVGTPSVFSTLTIDQSAKQITALRMGAWAGGRPHAHDCDVVMLIGVNPLVSLLPVPGLFVTNPTKEIKAARQRGTRFIVIDPRRTETARYADVFLQPYPGQDPAIAAGLLRIILTNGWHDEDFCRRYVAGLDQLRAAVERFTPEHVAERAGIRADDLVAAARLFARDAERSVAASGTGPDMSPRSNLAEHLIEALNVVCGRFLRAGERVRNPGVLRARTPKRAEVIAPTRPWETGRKSRVGGYGTLLGEMMSGVLADEILAPGDGQIRAVINIAGNPVSVVPDTQKAERAFKSLELLVSIDPHMSTTARLSHYVIAPRLGYERPDIPFLLDSGYPEPFSQYTQAIIEPPADSDVMEDWYFFWGVAKRMGLALEYEGTPLDMDTPPTTEALLELAAGNAQVPLAEIRRHPRGAVFDLPEQLVEPGQNDARFDIMPADVREELGEVAAERTHHGAYVSHGKTFSHLLAVRRLRDVKNTSWHKVPELHRRVPFNHAFMNPQDMTEHGLNDGDTVSIVSDHGRIPAIVKADATLRDGVVSMAHGFGELTEDKAAYEAAGANTNLLISNTTHVEAINAMPRMSAIPVNILKESTGSDHR